MYAYGLIIQWVVWECSKIRESTSSRTYSCLHGHYICLYEINL